MTILYIYIYLFIYFTCIKKFYITVSVTDHLSSKFVLDNLF